MLEYLKPKTAYALGFIMSVTIILFFLLLFKTVDVNQKILENLPLTIIGLTTAYVAYRQYVNDKNKIKLELYKKRYKIYEIIQKLLSKIMQNNSIETIDILQFNRGTKETKFLFQKDIENYITLIYKKTNRFEYLSKQIESSSTSDDKKNEYLNEQEEITIWFGNQFEESTMLFKKYLDFSEIF